MKRCYLDEVEPLAEPLPVAPELAPGEAEPEAGARELELPAEPIEPEPEAVPELEPEAALPLRLLCWSALEPAPALSRLHAVMPTASTAAASAAVSFLTVIA